MSIPPRSPAAEPADNDLVPLNKVAELRHVSPATRWRWAMSGALECCRVGKRLYTTPAAVRRFLASARLHPIPSAPPPADSPTRRQVERASATDEVRRRLKIATD